MSTGVINQKVFIALAPFCYLSTVTMSVIYAEPTGEEEMKEEISKGEIDKNKIEHSWNKLSSPGNSPSSTHEKHITELRLPNKAAEESFSRKLVNLFVLSPQEHSGSGENTMNFTDSDKKLSDVNHFKVEDYSQLREKKNAIDLARQEQFLNKNYEVAKPQMTNIPRLDKKLETESSLERWAKREANSFDKKHNYPIKYKEHDLSYGKEDAEKLLKKIFK